MFAVATKELTTASPWEVGDVHRYHSGYENLLDTANCRLRLAEVIGHMRHGISSTS